METVVENNSNRPEPILSAAEWDHLLRVRDDSHRPFENDRIKNQRSLFSVFNVFGLPGVVRELKRRRRVNRELKGYIGGLVEDPQ